MNPSACANAGDELYLVASGGEPVGSAQGSNTALVMTSVAGPCGNQFTHSFNIDEVTTVATEYALSGFSTDYQHVGTSLTNAVGLTNAFATVTNLVNLSTGLANTTPPAYVTPPVNTTADVFSAIVPYDTINSIANVLASCVNAAAGATDPACTNLFSYTGGSNSLPAGQNGVQGPVASTTADAVLYIAHNPGLPSVNGFATTNNVAALLALPTPQAPFNPILTSTPNDLTLTVNYVGGGLGGSSLATAAGGINLSIDANGNLWIPGVRRKSLIELSNLGAPITPTTQINGIILIQSGGYTGIGLNSPGRVDTDPAGNAWVADATNCLIGVNSSGTPLTGSPFTSACPSSGSKSVAVSNDGNVFIEGGSFIGAITDPAGASVTGFPVTGGIGALTTFIGPDEAGNVWFTDGGNNNGGYVNGSGTLSIPYAGEFGGGPLGFGAFGPAAPGGNGGLSLWILETGDTVQPVNATAPFFAANGFIPPTADGTEEVQADGSGRFFWNNYGQSPVPANVTEYLSNETQVSPASTGYTGGSALMNLDNPYGLVIDQSGNAWVVNQNNYNALHKTGPYGSQYVGNGSSASNVTEFVGLAAPSQPVNALNAANHTYGVKP
jgi:streptogramin lyase